MYKVENLQRIRGERMNGADHVEAVAKGKEEFSTTASLLTHPALPPSP